MTNPVSGVKANVSNIHDNIGEMMKKYDIGSYLEKTEVGKYIEDKSPLKDLVMKIKELLGWVMGILDKIFALIDAILSLLEWLFSSIMEFLKELLMLIFSFLEGFGFHIGFRNSILEALLRNCFSDGGNNFNPDPITGFILGGLLGFSICENDATAYSRLYNEYQKRDKELSKIDDELFSLTSQLNTLANTADIRYIKRDIANTELNILLRLSEIDDDVASLRERINSYNTRLSELMKEYDDVSSGKHNGDLHAIDVKITMVSNEIDTLNKEIQSHIAKSTDPEVEKLKAVIANLTDKLKGLEDSKDPRYYTVLGKVRDLQRKKSDRIAEIDEMFRRIAKTQIAITGKSDKVTPEVYIASIMDVMSTTPGMEAVKLYNDLSLVITDSLTYKLYNNNGGDVVIKPYPFVKHFDKTSVLKSIPVEELEKRGVPEEFLSKLKASKRKTDMGTLFPTIVATPGKNVSRQTGKSEGFDFTAYGIHKPDYDLKDLDTAISKIYDVSSVDGAVIAGTGSKTYLHNDPTFVSVGSGIHIVPIERFLSEKHIEDLIYIYKTTGNLNLTDRNVDLYRRPLMRSLLWRLAFDVVEGGLTPTYDVVKSIDGKALTDKDGNHILKTKTGYALSSTGEEVITDCGFLTFTDENNFAITDTGNFLLDSNGNPVYAKIVVNVYDSDRDYKISPDGDLYMNRNGDICITRDVTDKIDRYRYPTLTDNGDLELKRAIVPSMDGNGNITLGYTVKPKLDSKGRVVSDDMKGYVIQTGVLPLYTANVDTITTANDIICTTANVRDCIDGSGNIYIKDNIVLIIGVDGKPLLSITGNPFYVIRNGDKVPVNDESSTIPDIVTKQKENDSLRIAVLSML